ncbi:deoxyribonuclease IV [Oceanithermus profundus]
MHYGFHNSISGRRGYAAALDRAEELGTTAAQLFAKSPRSWRTRSLRPGEAEAFRDALAIGHVRRTAIHASYLVNLGAEGELWEKSVFSLADDLEKAALLGVDYVIVHPGSGPPERVREGALKALALAPAGPWLLLENVAGRGRKVGRRFEELAALIEGTPMGVTFDTCHAFAAGYPLHEDPAGVLDELDRTVGLERVPLVHLNDSVGALASGVDHHANLGEGQIGAALAEIVRDVRLADKTFIMETPKEADGYNLQTFRRWAGLG